jgi:CheY-like chemotaxis protein
VKAVACLLDIVIPGMDGYELAKRLETAERRVSSIATMGWGKPEDKHRPGQSICT